MNPKIIRVQTDGALSKDNSKLFYVTLGDTLCLQYDGPKLRTHVPVLYTNQPKSSDEARSASEHPELSSK